MKISTITPQEFLAGKHVTLPAKRKYTKPVPPPPREGGPRIGTITPDQFLKGGVFTAAAGSRRGGDVGKGWRSYLDKAIKPLPEAQALVRQLLGEAFPLGFNAKRDDGDEIEWRYDPKAYGYRFSKWWDDAWTRKREALLNGAFQHQAHFKLDSEIQRFKDAGWEVRLLESVSVEQQLISLAKGIKHCGDYGTLYYHPEKHEVHWTAADSDGGPDYTPTDEIEKMLKLPGIKHVEIGDEWSPDEEEGWKRLNYE